MTMNGILAVDKPAGFTSHDVVAKLRGICGTRQIGHGGTLDPMATGVLPVFVGGAVKAVDLAPCQDKAYEAEILPGIATDTGDVTGAVLRQAAAQLSAAQLAAVLPRFLGPQRQLPPLYSAVKVDGRPLYDYARKGEDVKRKQRDIVIHKLEILNKPAEEGRFWLRVECSRGTYIRTLVEDIGAALGLPATLSALRRTQSGVFEQGQAYTLAAIQAARDEGRLESFLRPVEELFAALPALPLNEGQARRILNGAPVYRAARAAGLYRLRRGAVFMGLGKVDAEGTLRVEKLFERQELPI